MHPPRVTLAELDARIEERLVGRPTPSGRRMVGMEMERLVLERGTERNAPLAACRELLGQLVDEFGAEATEEGGVLIKMRARDFGVSMEPGGQLEFDSDPASSLAEIEELFGRVSAAIDRRLLDTPYELRALGHAPQTPVEEIELLPRPRYRIMDAAMSARGVYARNMMRATAGLQITCDFVDRADAGRRLALLNRLVPLLAAIGANSRLVAGKDSGFATFRHRVWWDCDPSRCGVPEGGLDAETAVEGYVRFARRALVLFREGDGGPVPAEAEPFEDLVARGGVTEADLDLHLSSLFPFVRLRNYLEIRCFDSVQWPLARSILALVSGVVYCDYATAAAEELSVPFALRDATELRALHLEAARLGLEASVPGGGAFRDLARRLVEIAAATIRGTACDWARVRDLDEVRKAIG